MDTTNGPLNIDSLLADIRKEAQALRVNRKEEFRPSDISAPVSLPEAKISNAFRFESKRSYQLNELLRYEDIEFVTFAYRGILQRDPDETGLDNYVSLLRRGGSKTQVLVDLVMSDEGRERGVQVRGLGWRSLLFRLQRKLFPKFSIAQRLTSIVDYCLGPWNGAGREAIYQVETHQQQYLQRLVSELNTELSAVKQQLGAVSVLSGELQSVKAAQLEENNQIEERRQQLEQKLATMRMQMSYQQRNQELFQQELLAAGADKVGSTNEASGNAELVNRNLAGDSVHTQGSLAVTEQVIEQHRDDKLDAYYIAFEDACRGSREEIKDNFRVYLPLLNEVLDSVGADTPILDVGCGRGEWLELIKEQGWQGEGIDLNKVMVQQCSAQQLKVEEADVVIYLRSVADSSLAMISGFHIIEHLPFSELYSLFEEAARVLKPGGAILFETPNPENVLVGSHTFYHDPTHRNPITPSGIEFLADYAGFCQAEIMRLHPYPEEAKVPGNDPLTERVNGHLCGPQDFAIIARKPLLES
ncbi:methyltransferase domain-containing protein [Motiliproteus sp. MSK22-1]|uniref:methyltransferase domain-containing protein n=1 Tax=Motiliproteus sp. MSK22-1 TaxID=1897630 RepID=UPI0009770C49|nr:methyltransferase domain-containing protein [Motiliproteus sp. MSK22-1]OMH30407.1 hypothetical protein BGP75_18710 [Motiliproteus sp. MSK22-1]